VVSRKSVTSERVRRKAGLHFARGPTSAYSDTLSSPLNAMPTAALKHSSRLVSATIIATKSLLAGALPARCRVPF
jgi:hypothetical protein